MPRSLLIYKVQWSHNEGTELWLKTLMKGFSLNICCGKSKLGDIRADIKREMKPDVLCDVHNLPFRLNSFDTVFCDPPFSLFNRFKWVYRLSQLARKRFIICHPQINILIKKRIWKKSIYATGQRPYGLFLKLYSVFDRKDEMITKYA